MIEIWNGTTDLIRPLLEEWHKEQKGTGFGVDVTVDKVINDIVKCVEIGGDVIVASKDAEPVGLLVIFPMQSLVGEQMAGFEKYWYVRPGNNVGMKLFREAQKWCKSHNCSLLVMCASNLASNMHDKVSEFYQKMGMKLFETTFIMEIA